VLAERSQFMHAVRYRYVPPSFPPPQITSISFADSQPTLPSGKRISYQSLLQLVILLSNIHKLKKSYAAGRVKKTPRSRLHRINYRPAKAGRGRILATPRIVGAY